MKALKPSARENKRYLLLSVKGGNLKSKVNKAVLDGIGTIGTSRTGLFWIKENIIAVNREAVNEVRACFAISPDEISVLRVSGTRKGLRR